MARTSALRRTIRRCTALLLVVLGPLTADVAELASYGVGRTVGMVALVGGLGYLVVSELAQATEAAAPPPDSGPGADGNDGGSTRGEGPTDGSRDADGVDGEGVDGGGADGEGADGEGAAGEGIGGEGRTVQ